MPVGVMVRASGFGSSNLNEYGLRISQQEIYCYKYVAGAYIQLGVETTGRSGEVDLEIRVIGDTIYCYLDGEIASGMSGGGIYQDTDLASGDMGIQGYSNSNTPPYIDDWECGDFSETSPIAGSISGQATTNAAIKGKGALLGNIDGAAITGSAISGKGSLSGSILGQA